MRKKMIILFSLLLSSSCTYSMMGINGNDVVNLPIHGEEQPIEKEDEIIEKEDEIIEKEDEIIEKEDEITEENDNEITEENDDEITEENDDEITEENDDVVTDEDEEIIEGDGSGADNNVGVELGFLGYDGKYYPNTWLASQTYIGNIDPLYDNNGNHTDNFVDYINTEKEKYRVVDAFEFGGKKYDHFDSLLSEQTINEGYFLENKFYNKETFLSEVENDASKKIMESDLFLIRIPTASYAPTSPRQPWCHVDTKITAVNDIYSSSLMRSAWSGVGVGDGAIVSRQLKDKLAANSSEAIDKYLTLSISRRGCSTNRPGAKVVSIVDNERVFHHEYSDRLYRNKSEATADALFSMRSSAIEKVSFNNKIYDMSIVEFKNYFEAETRINKYLYNELYSYNLNDLKNKIEDDLILRQDSLVDMYRCYLLNGKTIMAKTIIDIKNLVHNLYKDGKLT